MRSWIRNRVEAKVQPLNDSRPNKIATPSKRKKEYEVVIKLNPAGSVWKYTTYLLKDGSQVRNRYGSALAENADTMLGAKHNGNKMVRQDKRRRKRNAKAASPQQGEIRYKK